MARSPEQRRKRLRAALSRLAQDQAGTPEGENARRRLREMDAVVDTQRRDQAEALMANLERVDTSLSNIEKTVDQFNVRITRAMSALNSTDWVLE